MGCDWVPVCATLGCLAIGTLVYVRRQKQRRDNVNNDANLKEEVILIHDDKLADVLNIFGDPEHIFNVEDKMISSEQLNSLLKGILFVQEMNKYNNIDHFYKAFPQKYRFLFMRRNQEDEIMFQGSTAENLAMYMILVKLNIQRADGIN